MNRRINWKKLAMATALVFVMIGAAGFGWAADVSFNYNASLSWKDYQRVDRVYDAGAWGDGLPSCESHDQRKEYSQYIPFEQEVSLEGRFLHSCKSSAATSYRREEDSNWITFSTFEFPNQEKLYYQGNLMFNVYARNKPGSGVDCKTKCTTRLTVTYYDVTPTTNQQKVISSQSASIPIAKARKELMRIPVPTTQFTPQSLREENEAKCSKYTATCLASPFAFFLIAMYALTE